MFFPHLGSTNSLPSTNSDIVSGSILVKKGLVSNFSISNEENVRGQLSACPNTTTGLVSSPV